MLEIVAAAAAFLIGTAAGYLFGKSKAAPVIDNSQELAAVQSKYEAELSKSSALQASLTSQENAHGKLIKAKEEAFSEAINQSKTVLKSIAADALANNNTSFIALAKSALDQDREVTKQSVNEIINPIRETIGKINDHANAIAVSNTSIHSELETSAKIHAQLSQETRDLKTAMRSPNSRGSWGELTLVRTMEIAGLTNHVSFIEQDRSVDGQRPDVVIDLPNSRKVIIDAKVPLLGYMNSIETVDQTEIEAYLADHARAVRKHVKDLAGKAYWEGQAYAVDLVIMFVPSDVIYDAAIKQDPKIIEDSLSSKILIATPTTLVGIVRVLERCWQNDSINKNVKEVTELGGNLYEAVGKVSEHLEKLSKSLRGSVDSYNAVVGSFDRNVLPKAMKLHELGITSKDELPNIEAIDTEIRTVPPKKFNIREMPTLVN